MSFQTCLSSCYSCVDTNYIKYSYLLLIIGFVSVFLHAFKLKRQPFYFTLLIIYIKQY